MNSKTDHKHPVFGEEQVLAILSPANLVRLEQIRSKLTPLFPGLRVIAPDSLEHLAEVVSLSAAKYPLLLSIGGDGTFHRVLNCADTRRQVLSCIPLGTGNDFARATGIPRKFNQLTGWLAGAVPKATDYGVANGMKFHNSAGIGIDTATLHLRASRRNLLTRNYTLAFLLALARMKPSRCTAAGLDDNQQSDCFWLLAMNSCDIGGGTKIAPQASIDDGLLDFIQVSGCSKLELLQMLPSATRGNHLGCRFVNFQQRSEAVYRFDSAQEYLALDGELVRVDCSEISFTCVAGGMQLLR